jgi:hypothetical protein
MDEAQAACTACGRQTCGRTVAIRRYDPIQRKRRVKRNLHQAAWYSRGGRSNSELIANKRRLKLAASETGSFSFRASLSALMQSLPLVDVFL